MIAAWSSGTGSSGIIGSVSWAALIEFGFNPRVTMRFMLIVPIIEAFTFWFLLRSPREKILKDNSNKINIATIESNLCPSSDCVLPNLDVKLSGLKAKLKCLPSLAPYICPLVLVFIFEYICVSGLVSDTSKYMQSFFFNYLKIDLNFIKTPIKKKYIDFARQIKMIRLQMSILLIYDGITYLFFDVCRYVIHLNVTSSCFINILSQSIKNNKKK